MEIVRDNTKTHNRTTQKKTKKKYGILSSSLTLPIRFLYLYVFINIICYSLITWFLH